MKLRKTISHFPFFLFLLLVNGCLDPYAPPATTSSKIYLVVDGFLNAGDSSCTITLTRSQALSVMGAPTSVTGANVVVEDSDGGSTSLSSQGNGVYSNARVPLNLSKTYRVRIIDNGSTYYSDFVPINQSPPIDSVSWSLAYHGAGDPSVGISVSTHGNANQSQYYLWKFQETWQYSAKYSSDLRFQNGKVSISLDTVFYCWQTLNSSSILISSTTELTKNRVSQFPITATGRNDIKFKEAYSILVSQLSLTQDAFEYYQQLKANTENLGTIFGPQPSLLRGNFHSVTTPSEPVFGYFMATTVSQKRIFVLPDQLPSLVNPVVTGYETCRLDTLKIKDVPTYAGNKVFVTSYGYVLEGYLITTIDCVDCRLNGGTNHKPSYWF